MEEADKEKSGASSEVSTQNMYIVMPGHTIQVGGGKKHCGDDESNVFECLNPRELTGVLKTGAVMKVSSWIKAKEEEANEARIKAEEQIARLSKESDERVSKVKETINATLPGLSKPKQSGRSKTKKTPLSDPES